MEKVKDGRVTSGNVTYWPCTIFSNKKKRILSDVETGTFLKKNADFNMLSETYCKRLKHLEAEEANCFCYILYFIIHKMFSVGERQAGRFSTHCLLLL